MHLPTLILLLSLSAFYELAAAHLEATVNVLAVLPSVWKSHYIFSRQILRALPAAKYNVTLLSPYANELLDESHRINWLELPLVGLLENWQEMGLSFDVEQQKHNVIERVTRLIYAGTTNVDHLLGQSVMRQMWSQQFDLVVIDLFLSDALLGLAHIYKVPLVVISASGAHAWLDELMGNPRNPALDPSSFLHFTEYMSVWQRSLNTLMHTFERLTQQFFHKVAQQTVYVKHFQATLDESLPHHTDLAANISLMLLNTHAALQYPRAYLPNMLQVAGAHLQKEALSTLSNHLREHIENSPSGRTVYISLGANARTADMSRDKLNVLIETCTQLSDVHFLLKWETDVFEADKPLPNNVLISAWFPQQAILAHENVVAFVSTMGLLSVMEAINSETPMLALPVLPEQFATASRLAARGVAVVVPYEDITNDNYFLPALQQLLLNKIFFYNMQHLKAQFRYNCQTPLELCLEHIEGLADKLFDRNYLQSPAGRLNFWEMELLDVRTILTLGFCVSLAIPFLLTCCILRRSYNNQNATLIEQQKIMNLQLQEGVDISHEPAKNVSPLAALRRRREMLRAQQQLKISEMWATN